MVSKIYCLLLTLFTINFVQAQTAYDKKLADSLGSDEHGMCRYQFVILKTGPNNLTDKEKVQKLFRGHMDNITKLVKDGKLIVAGPFSKNNKQYRGLFIFKGKNMQEVENLLQTDPAIKEGLLATEIYDWYGSAALPMYLPYSEKITKQKH